MNRRKIRLDRLIAAALVCLTLLSGAGRIPAGNGSGFPAAAEETEQAAPTIRVLLRRLNLGDRVDLSLTAAYQGRTGTGDGILFPAGSEVSVLIREKTLVLFFGGYALTAGTSLTLKRTAGAEGGFRVRPNEGLYAGDLRLTMADGALQAVLRISVEEYLLGVLPYEMGDDFPMEALKAQAVCARTYALSRRNGTQAWDVMDNTNDQVYRGASPDTPRCAEAVRATAGVVATVDGKLANCYYSASNGGLTELPAVVWPDRVFSDCFAVTEDPYDLENPASSVRRAELRRDGTRLPAGLVRLLREEAAKRLKPEEYPMTEEAFRVEAISGVRLTTPRWRNPDRGMTKLEVTFSYAARRLLTPETADPGTGERTDAPTPDPAGEKATASPAEDSGTPGSAAETPQAAPAETPAPVWGDFEPMGPLTVELTIFPDVERVLGLGINREDNEVWTVEETGNGFSVQARRFGHGVGLSQRGAQWMALRYGKDYREILAFYYPGMELRKAPAGAPALPTADPRLAVSPGPAATPTPRPTLMPVSTEPMPEGAWLASVERIDDDSSLNLRSEPSPSGEILRRLYKHQQLLVLETCEDPAWVHVRTDALEGYVMVSFLEKIR